MFLKVGYKLIKGYDLLLLAILIIVLAILFMMLSNIRWHMYWAIIQQEESDYINALFFWNFPFIKGLRLMSIWVLAYHLYSYHKEQIKTIKHQAELSLLAKEGEFNHLSKKMKPQFLFNTLDSVKTLISEKPYQAKRSIDLLYGLLHSSIYTREECITLEEELCLVEDYIEIEQLRFKQRLQLETKIDTKLLDYKILTLSIQTLVENAVKYGIHHSIRGGKIVVAISKESGGILIQVTNPGCLFFKERIDGNLGLNNLKQRLQLHYKEKAKFTLIEEASEGTVKATITIPISN